MQELVHKLTNITNDGKEEERKYPSWYLYCWSHGRTGDSRHTSATCGNPKQGHNKTDTIADRKKGSHYRCE